jgi:hypothetical protein
MTNPIVAGRMTRRSLLGGLAAAACTAGAPRLGAQDDERAEGELRSVTVNSRSIAHFQPSRPETKRFGDLEFRGGLVLTSPAEYFGGWSGLVMEADGRSLLAISDTGFWLRGNVAYAGIKPAAIAQARMGSLRALRDRALRDKREQDAEAVTLVDGSLERGTLLIGFERLHRIGRYEIRGGQIQPPSEYLSIPAEARRMPRNQGFEALAVIRAGPLRGSLVAFAERFTREAAITLVDLVGTPHRLQLLDIDGFNITDAAGLPDGGLLRWSATLLDRRRPHAHPPPSRPRSGQRARMTAASCSRGTRATTSTIWREWPSIARPAGRRWSA